MNIFKDLFPNSLCPCLSGWNLPEKLYQAGIMVLCVTALKVHAMAQWSQRLADQRLGLDGGFMFHRQTLREIEVAWGKDHAFTWHSTWKESSFFLLSMCHKDSDEFHI